MRPLTTRNAGRLCLVMTLGVLGCGGSRIRGDADVTIDPEPEPDPTGQVDAAGDEPDAAVADPDAASPGGPDPGGPMPPPAVAGTCGGVTCPELFDRIALCRPAGICLLSLISLTVCYGNGVKIVSEGIPTMTNLVGMVKQPNGSDCYRARVSQVANVTQVIWETPAGDPIATGVIDGANRTITCGGTTAPLTDPSCIAVPSLAGCTPIPTPCP
jgi:hypothetical protein